VRHNVPLRDTATLFLLPRLGNNGLWLSLMVFFALRAATLGAWLPRIDRSLSA